MLVAPSVFVSAMTGHWQHTLNNTVSPALQAVWSQMAETFNRHIQTHGTEDGKRWRVLQPATGTGKSQGLAVYCSLLPRADHPGVLIVTRLKAQADEVAETINRLASGDPIAFAYHGDSKCPVETLVTFPVLVITHRAYEVGLDAINRDQLNRSNWSHFHRWNDETRKLVVIDEALDIIEEAQVDLNKVRFIRAVIPFEVAERFPTQLKAIAALEDILSQMARVAKARQEKADGGNVEQERVLWKGDLKLPVEYDMTPLRKALRDIRLDRQLLQREDAEQNRRLIARYDTILREVQATLENWNWYAKKLSQHTINTARLIVPDDIEGAVILDATASSNLVYQLFDKVDVVPVPANARRYQNVTLHVSTGHAVGKTSLVKNAKDEAPRLIENLRAAIGADRKVFVCCHQHVEHHVMGFDTGFTAFDAGHWNAVDGRNDWQDFDTAVIFGLPYRDKVWSANTFMALRGLQDDSWLNSEGDRPFLHYKDVRHALEVGQLFVSIVQAINRIRCRRVIDADGNCPTADVFLLLPNDATGRELLQGVEREMPGINIVSWNYEHAKRKPRKSNHEEALVRFAQAMRPGKRSIHDIRSELSIPSTPMERLIAAMKDTGSSLHARLTEAGTKYEVTGVGRGARSHLVKT